MVDEGILREAAIWLVKASLRPPIKHLQQKPSNNLNRAPLPGFPQSQPEDTMVVPVCY